MAKMGRPKVDTEAVTVRMHVDQIRELDEARKLEPDLPTRPEMLRRIFQRWLDDNRPT